MKPYIMQAKDVKEGMLIFSGVSYQKVTRVHINQLDQYGKIMVDIDVRYSLVGMEQNTYVQGLQEVE